MVNENTKQKPCQKMALLQFQWFKTAIGSKRPMVQNGQWFKTAQTAQSAKIGDSRRFCLSGKTKPNLGPENGEN
jgi:hypothetical protein